MSIKLIALDLDGTIFADDLVISERMRNAIRLAQQQGVVVTLATGRMFRSARQIAADLSVQEPLICYQGAMVAHSTTGDMLYHRTIPLDSAQRIISEANERGLHLNLYLNDNIYVSHITPEAEFYSRINMGIPINEVGNLNEWLHTMDGAEPTKLVIVTDAGQTNATLEFFTKLFGGDLQVTKSHPRFTEFTNKECSKGTALAFLAKDFNILKEEVMAIGDGHNDLDMIAWAGYGVAMSTSPQAVRDAAHTITATLEEDGAAQAIERFVIVEK